MKKWLYLAAALLAVGILSRLPHPARDAAKLSPVQTVYLYIEEDAFHIETDTGDHGSGPTLAAAVSDMKANASAELFLETAEYLLLSPNTPIPNDLFTLLRPSCCVCYTDVLPDLPAATQYLTIHPPEYTLAHLRAELANVR